MKTASKDSVLITFRLPQKTADRLAAHLTQRGDLTESVREALEARFHDIKIMLTKAPRMDGEQQIGELKYLFNSQRLSVLPLSAAQEAKSLGHPLSAESRNTSKHSIKLSALENEMLQWSAAFYGQGVNDFIALAIKDRLDNASKNKKLLRANAVEFKTIVDSTRLMVIRVERPETGGDK